MPARRYRSRGRGRAMAGKLVNDGGVGGPVRQAWREGTLTRARELASQTTWAAQRCAEATSKTFVDAIEVHLAAAREAGEDGRRFTDKAALDRAMSILDAAEALLLSIAPADYLLGRLPACGTTWFVTSRRRTAGDA